jgi:hypothetical protein
MDKFSLHDYIGDPDPTQYIGDPQLSLLIDAGSDGGLSIQILS